MSGWLIHLPADDAGAVTWWAIGATEGVSPAPDGAPPIGPPPEPGAVWALAPTSRLLLQTLALPVRGREALQRAVPYAMEESLPGELDDYHFTIGQRQPNKRIPVAAVSRSDLARWRAQLHELGFPAVPLLPACLALAWEPGYWTVAWGPGEISVRTGPWTGWGCEPEALVPLLRRLWGNADDPPATALRVIADAAQFQELAALLPEIDMSPWPPEQGWQRPARETVAGLALGGTGSAHDAAMHAILKRWRLPVAVAVLWGMAAAGYPTYQAIVLEQQRRQLTAQMEQLYRDTFPEARRVVDPATQMALHLKRLRQGSGVDPLLRLLATVSAPLTGLPDYALEDLQYQNGVLELSVRTSDLAALEAVAPLLAQSGVAMSRLSATTDNGGTRARIRLESQS